MSGRDPDTVKHGLSESYSLEVAQRLAEAYNPA
jgi:hypothetical protein